MVDQVDLMLGDLNPGVDPRFRTARQGNLIEQAFAVARGELSEAEIAGLIGKAGVGKEFAGLPNKLKLLVMDGLSNLWKIDRVGRSIEQKDGDNVGKVDEMRNIYEEDSEQIKRQHHSQTSEWLPHSVNLLVQAATEKDSGKRSTHKNGVMSFPDSYIRKLTGVGYEYRERSSNIPDNATREHVNVYLAGERDSDLELMRNILFQRVGGVVTVVKPAPETTK